MSTDYEIRPMHNADLSSVAELEARVYGPGRFARTAYRLREGSEQRTELCMTAWAGRELAGAVRFTHINLGPDCHGALLGPLTVNPDHAGNNLGIRLIERAIDGAKALDLDALILVGDLPYYQKAGFKLLPPGRISMPGPVDPTRLLIHELKDGTSEKCMGVIKARDNNRER